MLRSLFALMLLVAPASAAAGWGSYLNPRFGAAVAIPPGFANDAPPPENADGATFHDTARQGELLVWGGNLLDGGLEQDAVSRVEADVAAGWKTGYRRAGRSEAGTTIWYVFSGTRAGRIMYEKALLSCGGSQAVHFRLEYPEPLRREFNDIVARMANSLRAEPTADCPVG